MGTWELYPRKAMEAVGARPKRCKGVYKLKVTKDGEIERAKYRMVVQGFSLIPGVEYHNSYSSVLSKANLRTMLYISAQTGERLSCGDVGNAYLEASLDENEHIFVEQHQFCEKDGYPAKDYVLKLKKCLYGLPQAGRGYQRVYTELMHKLGFRQSSAENCLFVYHHPEHERIICGNYVDDLLCLTDSVVLRDWWRNALREEFRKVEFDDELDYVLGIKVNRGVDKDGKRYVELDHAKAFEKIAESMQIDDNSGRADTPMDHAVKLTKKKEGEDDDSSYIPNFKYATVLGGMMYLATLSRPDLATAINKLSRFVTDPSHAHHRALHRVVRHAYQTRDRFLRYTETKDDPFRMQAACDSSFADCVDTGRSTIGRCIWMGKNPSGLIDWSSGLPKSCAQNTTEAEVSAAVECAKDVIYTRELLHDLGYDQRGSTRVHIDSNTCMAQLNAVKGVVRARHYVVPQ